MEKGKKKTSVQRHDKDDENIISSKTVNENEDLKPQIKTNASKRRQKKTDAKVKDPSSEDDDYDDAATSQDVIGITSKFGILNVDEGSDKDSDKDSDNEPEINNKNLKKRGKNKKKQLPVSESDATDVNNEKCKPSALDTGKAGKNDAAKKKADDDNFDAVLAEFSASNNSLPATDKKDKRKKKKGGREENEPDIDVDPVSSATNEKVIENRVMTQEEIGKLMDEMYGDDSEEEKKKKKEMKKKQKQKSNKKNDDDDAGGDNKLDNIAKEISTTSKISTQTADKSLLTTTAKVAGVTDKAATPTAPAEQKKELTKTEKQKLKKMEKLKEAGVASVNESEKLLEKEKQVPAKPSVEKAPAAEVELKEDASSDVVSKANNEEDVEGLEEGGKKSKKDKRKKKGEKEKKEEKETEKKPSKLAQKILEQRRLLLEEQERLRKEEEERIRKEEEAERQKEEKARLEKERKEREKQKKKEKIERKKAEGSYLTAKQKEDRKRAQQMLEAIRLQGAEVPDLAAAAAERPKKRVIYTTKKKRPQVAGEQQEAEPATATSPTEENEGPELEVEINTEITENSPEIQQPEDVAEEEDVKEAWDASSSSDEGETVEATSKEATKSVPDEEAEPEELEESESSSSEESGSEESSESDSDEAKSPQETAKEKALQRIKARKEEAEAKRSLDNLRAPVVCVLGHVDTGKTKILDKLRRTNVQDGEAGGITQQIGATNVPQDTIREQTKMCKEFAKVELKLPGLLIIDTPGHESFSNLRNRGSSLCDIAILVVDIMHGLEPQTKESIELLKGRKTPFVVALNKIDRLNEWQTSPHTDVETTLSKQKPSTRLHFEDRVKQIVVEFAELGLNVALFYENKNVREYISMVPTSAHSGDGMGNLIALICELTQTLLAKRIMYSNDLQATVMEVKALPGLGTTIDVILVNGRVCEGDTIIVAGQEGPIVTQVRGLLMPQPLRELRVKSAYEHHKEVQAAQGCKIIAKDLEKALAGLPLFVAHHQDEVEVYRDELSQMLTDVLGSIKVQERGVFVQASTLGSLEALLVFLKSSKIPYAGINIGPIHKRDVMKASVMLEHDPQYAVILAFDVKVEREAQEMADGLGVRIFVADIIYHLFDRFTKYREEWLLQKRDEFKHLAVFPCKLRIYPEHVFNSRDPIIVGVAVEAGFLKEGTMLCVPSKEFLEVGRVSSIQINHKPVEKAMKGQDVCIKIDPVPGEAPKMFGRHFDQTDLLVSKISRETIDVVKDYFRDEMTKSDWQLVVELKKTFGIV